MASSWRLSAAALLGMVLIAGSALAQTRAGMIEVSAATASYASRSSSGVDTSELDLQAKVGYFVKPELEVAGVVGYGSVSGGGSTSSNTSLGVQADYLFNTKQSVVPFAGVNAGTTDSSGGSSSTYVGADAGAKFFLSPNVSVGPTAYFQAYSTHSTTVVTLVGAFSIFF